MAPDEGRAVSETHRPPLGLVLFALLTTLATGCKSPPTLYDWGLYEDILWESYRAESDPATQLVRLEADVERIVASGRRVPPGVHAHIGFLRFATGDAQVAAEHFAKERELFPESTVFMDGILARLEGPGELTDTPLPISPTPSTQREGASEVSP
jgi:hypothetical protein